MQHFSCFTSGPQTLITLELSQPAGKLRMVMSINTPEMIWRHPETLNRPMVEATQMLSQASSVSTEVRTARPEKTVAARQAGDRIEEKAEREPRHASTPSRLRRSPL